MSGVLHVALYEPEIPPNTGNIIRLCAIADVVLHLIHPLGFQLDDKRLRRAGLDYGEWASVEQYTDYADFVQKNSELRLLACTTHAQQFHTAVNYAAGDCLLFGPESRGLPEVVRNGLPPEQRIRIPMHVNSRSLNLSNACAIIVYEAWRQLGFSGLV